MNKIVVKEYLGNKIEFKVVDGEVYANANQMASGFGGSKKLENWKNSPNTKRYIEALSRSLKNGERDLIIVNQGGRASEQGTWIHEKLVLSFARYLNVDFEIWTDEQIATLLREGRVEIKPIKKLEDKNPTEILEDNGRALNNFFSNLGLNIPKEIIASTAITTTTNMTGYDFSEVKMLLNKQDEEEYHSASGLLSRLNIKRNRTNEVLILLGLQQKGTTSMQKYALTDLGKNYGVERSYVNKGHQGYQILWKETLINYVKTRINEIPSEWVKYGDDE